MPEARDPRLEALGEELDDSDQHEFNCENCAAPVVWDPERDALACQHCGHVQAVPRDEGTIIERALDDVGAAARGLGVEMRAVRCSTCGATVAFEGADTATQCVFCGSSSVLAQDANRNALRPESLVPLDVGRERVTESFRKWLKGLWFRPNELKRTKDFRAIGIYVPFWTFDCHVASNWSADSGTYYWVTQPTMVMVKGKPRMKMKRVRKIRWRPAWGDRYDTFDDLLICASDGVARGLVDKLGGFDTKELVPYRPEYLAGWRAEEYRIDLDAGWDQGQERVVAKQKERCAGDVPGDTHRNLRVHNRISAVRWKHVLLPIWSLQYSFRGKPYTVVVNGQTGAVAGEAPYSWVKILLLVVGILAGIFIALAIAGVLGAVA